MRTTGEFDSPLPRLPYIPERLLVPENMRKVGLGLFIVDVLTGQIWCVQENQAKTETARTPQKVSLPLETRKEGELIWGNMLGGLQEFRPLLQNEHLYWISGHSYKGRYELIPKVHGDVILLALENRFRSEKLLPLTSEVSRLGWRTVEELLQQKEILRSGVARYLELAQTQDWVKNFQTAFRKEKAQFQSTALVEVPNTAVAAYNKYREEVPDILVR